MNKSKGMFGVISAIAFVLLGFYLVDKAATSNMPILLKTVGYGNILLFSGLLGLKIVKYLKKEK